MRQGPNLSKKKKFFEKSCFRTFFYTRMKKSVKTLYRLFGKNLEKNDFWKAYNFFKFCEFFNAVFCQHGRFEVEEVF